MKIEVDQRGNLVAKEVFLPLILETAEGNRIAVCMRDDTVEISVVGSDAPYRANIKDGTFEPL